MQLTPCLASVLVIRSVVRIHPRIASTIPQSVNARQSQMVSADLRNGSISTESALMVARQNGRVWHLPFVGPKFDDRLCHRRNKVIELALLFGSGAGAKKDVEARLACELGGKHSIPVAT